MLLPSIIVKISSLWNVILRFIWKNQVKNLCISPPRNLKILGKIYVNAQRLKIGNNVTFYPGAYLWGYDIEIGDNVDIGTGTVIYSRNGVHIGNNTSIAGQCYIIDSNHGTKQNILIQNQPMESAPNGICIGDDVWIAAQCTVLKGAQIGDHVVIGAKSLVNKPIPENAIAFGIPAKVIKYRE